MPRKIPAYETEIRLRLYNEGKSDNYIAKVAGTTAQNIYFWRKRNNFQLTLL